jgi:hypothetical protein
MNFKARVRLFMSQFKMKKPYYLQLEKLFENKDSGIYLFNDDGLLIATTKRQDVEQGIRASVRGNIIAENFPRGVAVTEDGIKLIEDKVSVDFINVMKTITAFNKEFYARGYTKTRRDNSNWGRHRSNTGSNQGKPSEDRHRGTERSAGAKKGA